MKQNEFAQHLGWNTKNVYPRLKALGLLDGCTRCFGSGHFSYCQMYGTKCFKCSGHGLQLPKFSVKLAKLVAERVAAGGLDAYLTNCKRIAEAKRVLPALLAEAQTVGAAITDLYSPLSAETETSAFVQSAYFQIRTRQIDLESGTRGQGWAKHPYRLGVIEIQWAAERGEMDAAQAVTLIQSRIESIRALVAELPAAVAELRSQAAAA